MKDAAAQRLQRLADERAARHPIASVAASFSVMLRAADGRLRYVVRKHTAGHAVQDRYRGDDIVFFHSDEAMAAAMAAEMNRGSV